MSRARSLANLANSGVFSANASTSRVGINSTAPTKTLDVVGDGRVSGTLSIGGTINYEDVTSIDSIGVVTARDGVHIVSAGASIYSPANNELALYTNGSERVRVDSGGSVGIGTDNPDSSIALDIHRNQAAHARIWSNDLESGTSYGLLYLGDNSDDKYIIGYGSSHPSQPDEISLKNLQGPITFYNGASGIATERVRLLSDGKISVGTTAPRNIKPLGSTAADSRITIEGTDFASSVVSIIRNQNGTNGPYLTLGKSRGTQVGSYTSIRSGDDLGAISFVGFSTDSGTNRTTPAAYIIARADDVPFTAGDSHLPGKLSIYVGPDSNNTPYERLRIDSEGRATFLSNPGILIKTRADAVGAGISFTDHRTGNEDQFGDFRFFYRNGDTVDAEFGSMFRLDASEASKYKPGDAIRGGMALDIKGSVIVHNDLVVGYSTITYGTGIANAASHVPLLVATQATANFDDGGGAASRAFLRISDFSSSDNRFHGIDIRNKNSGDIRILNEDVATQNTANMLLVVDTGNTDELAIRHKIYGGTSRSRDYNLRRELYTNIDDVSTGGDITAKSNRLCFIADSGENANDMHRIEFWESTTTTTKLANMAIRYDGGQHSDGSDGSLTFEGSPPDGTRDFLTLSREGNLYLHRGQASIEKTSSGAVAPDTTTATAVNGANLELINTNGTTGSGSAITGVGLGTKGRFASIAFEDTTSDNTGTGGEIVFSTASTKTGALTERCRIRSNGIQMTSGDGIAFTATGDGSASMTSELLDDYEEGTWTPTAMFGGNSTGVVYGTNNGGSYTRVGRMVYLHCRFEISNNGTSTGDFTVGGLPYAAGNIQSGNSSLEAVSASIGYNAGGAFDLNTTMSGHSPIVGCTISNGATALTFRYHYYNGSNDSVAVTDSNMASASSFVIDVVYQA